MRLSRLIPLVAVAATLTCAGPALAAGGGGGAVIADCYAHQALTHTYSIGQLEDALRSMPADVSEYSDCQDVVHRALLVAEGKLHPGASTTGSSSGGSFLPTPLVVVLVILLLAAAALGGLALRRRRAV